MHNPDPEPARRDARRPTIEDIARGGHAPLRSFDPEPQGPAPHIGAILAILWFGGLIGLVGLVAWAIG